LARKRKKGKRGYIVGFDDASNGYIVVVDPLESQRCHVATESMKLLRRNREFVTTRIGDVSSGSFARLGKAAATTFEPAQGDAIEIDPESPLGRLPRPSMENLQGPRWPDTVFDDRDTEELFLA
jgi:hypothetical protein